MRTLRTYATARTYLVSTPKHPPTRATLQVKRLPTARISRGVQTQELIARVGRWMDSLTTGRTERTRVVAVTHPAVIRAAILVALDAPPKSFWRIDIAPVSRTVMHFRGHAWTLRSAP
ncbi:histidine phosphatase family protein [Mycolicibacterium vanbaalenii]|nr:histidine phosphatase family protein [Mycolicibacterium vanbaalenii]WND56153.1 histidine phosphatase family protein [Mycolicibacterium vanbaalenii]